MQKTCWNVCVEGQKEYIGMNVDEQKKDVERFRWIQIMKRFLELYKIEQKLFFRSGDVFVFNLCMPAAAMLLIAMIAGNKQAGDSGMTYLQSSYAALVAVGICCSAFMSIPIVMVDYRDKKILKHFYCSPCSPVWILGVDAICCAVMAILSAVLVTITAMTLFGYRMVGNMGAFIFVWFLVMTAMFSIGLLIASLCRTVKTMNAVTSMVYFPMLFLSGATIPYELFPKMLQKVADVMPLTQGIKLMKAVSMGTTVKDMGSIVVLLVAITVVCVIISVKAFRWE